jgi:chromate transporter
VRYGSLPAVRPALAGIKLAALAIVLRALWDFGRAALRTPLLWALAALSVVAIALGANELVVLLAAGLLAWAAAARARLATLSAFLPVAAPLAAHPSPLTLFLSFAKIGAVLFGSGYVLFAFLHAEFVERLGWLTTGQITDAIAAGQLTPGPLFSSATFVGYLVAGWKGALVATAGIFLPAFSFVALSAPLLPYVERHPALRAGRDGVVAASLALLAWTALGLGRDAFQAPALLSLITLPLALVALVRFRANTAWIILAGALLGLALA